MADEMSRVESSLVESSRSPQSIAIHRDEAAAQATSGATANLASNRMCTRLRFSLSVPVRVCVFLGWFLLDLFVFFLLSPMAVVFLLFFSSFANLQKDLSHRQPNQTKEPNQIEREKEKKRKNKMRNMMRKSETVVEWVGDSSLRAGRR